jgi:signal transduction histidine kinase/sensor domain CHASE-containing protein
MAVTLGGLLLVAWWLGGIWYARQLASNEHAEVAVQLSSRSAALQTAIGERFALLDGMVGLVQSQPSASAMDAAFAPFAASLMASKSSPGIRNFALFPDGEQRYEYPAASNEVPEAFHNLYTHPIQETRDNVARTLATRQVAVGAPRLLAQGGLGLVATQAVFAHDKLWGFVTMALDVPPILDEAGLVSNDAQSQLQTALADNSGNVFFGAAPLAAAESESIAVPLPEGAWRLYGAPRDGWLGDSVNELRLFQGASLAVVVLLTLVAWLALSRHERLIVDRQRLEKLESTERTLQTVTAALASAPSQAQIATIVFEQALPAVHTSAGLLMLRTDDAQHLDEVARTGDARFFADVDRAYALDDETTITRVARSGQPRWLDETSREGRAIVPLTSGAQLLGVVVLAFDETRALDAEDRRFLTTVASQCADAVQRVQLHRAEQRARAEAEEALVSRDTFLRTLAHDLKGPLASLAWQVQVLRRRTLLGKLNPGDAQAELASIAGQTAEAIAVIDELHDLTRAASGVPLRLRRETLDLAAVVRSVVQALPPSPVGVRCEAPEAGAAPIVVEADRARLARILRNLLGNAIKYSRAGGCVQVSVSVAGSEQQTGHAWAEVRVRDEGLGIPAADLPHVFDRYRRGTNVMHIDGEGLGLATVRHLTEQHGGQVLVDSQERVGSTFTLRLPLVTAARPAGRL